MRATKTAIDFWNKKRDEKARKKRMKLRDAKKTQRQNKYSESKKLGNKAVRNQRKKRRQLKEAYGK